MVSAFSRFPPRLQEAIAARLGWSSLRPVQELASHAILDGKNAVVLAPTAGGKTEASMFPLIASVMEQEPQGVGLIYIAPIKALLNNQAERLGLYTEMVGLQRFLWHGDIKESQKKAFLKEPATLLMTTPESLEVMLLSSRIPHTQLFADLRAVVIDEVHALAGSDRGTHLISVLERLAKYTPNDIQRVGLSATVGNPLDILKWLQGTSRREACVVDPPKIPSSKELRVYLKDTLGAIATHASESAQGKKSLFFCQSRSLAEALSERMRNRGTDVFVHHSSVSLEERTVAEARFHQGTNASIICTSTLELGIDVGDLDLVFQANAPSTVSSFLQRLGRTGRRANQRANTTFYCENIETVLQAIAIIELARQGWIESVPTQTRTWAVLVHQLLALTLQFGAISPERCWEQLSVVPDFSGITQAEFTTLIKHMLQHDYLFCAGGLLSMGGQAERVFGRKNFMELYAVFSSPVLYKVQTKAGYIIGSLEQAFVDKLVPEISSFLLGGRAWTVDHINLEEHSIRVIPAPRGKKPSWGGFAPQLLGFEICQRIAETILADHEIPYLDALTQTALEEYRADLRPLLQGDRSIQVESDRLLWWTFAGGQINHTLKYGLQFHHDWKIIADNFRLKIEGDSVSLTTLDLAIDRMSHAEFWQHPSTTRFIFEQLPNYRLSKFQQALPDDYVLEMVSSYLLDIAGTVRWIQSSDAPFLGSLTR
ncbi:MAG: DEAD/DEAH box helicase [Oculatellaceae cyanobacterium Prado106]|jgi:ATP-dependent Lhr-like helicase|nr:DEAD/DEAH box helicase [Oculatellaceae cyanobacterium Prado106]